MDERTYESLQRDKATYTAQIALGETVNNLHHNKDFNDLIKHLENKFNNVSKAWAKTQDPDLLLVMQWLLSFNNYLEDITILANAAKNDLKSINDFEINQEEL